MTDLVIKGDTMLYCGDCKIVMRDILDNSIDMTITSPPYDNLRNYDGYSFDFEDIVKELYRVTKQGGIVIWVVGDATINGSETGTSFRQALYFKEIGFNIHDTMIYSKYNSPPLTHRRYEQCFEYMFVLSKGRPKTFNPIKILCKYTGSTKNYKYICGSTKEIKSAIRSGMNRTSITHKEKYKNNIWEYKVGSNHSTKDKEAFQHPAIFPEQLVEDHILSWSNESDTILDCMMGSGTTGKMAIKHNRKFIGIEIPEKYFDIACSRIDKEINQIKLFR